MIAELLIVCVTVIACLAITARTLLERDRRRDQLQREVAMHERATVAPVAELAVAAVTLAEAAAALREQAGRRGPSRVGHRVTIHTKQPDDQTIFGVVVGDYNDRIALEDAEYVLKGRPGQPLPGRQDFDASDIAWIDVHGHVASVAEEVVA